MEHQNEAAIDETELGPAKQLLDDPDLEAMMFFTLFPYGVGHFNPVSIKRVSMREYIEHRLRHRDPRFRNNPEWRMWATGTLKSLMLYAEKYPQDERVKPYLEETDSD